MTEDADKRYLAMIVHQVASTERSAEDAEDAEDAQKNCVICFSHGFSMDAEDAEDAEDAMRY